MKSRRLFLLLTFIVAIAGLPLLASDSTSIVQLRMEAYGRLPLAFEPNVGQVSPGVRFIAHESGLTLLFNAEGLEIVGAADLKPITLGLKRMKNGGALRGDDLLPSHSNYLRGNDPSKWYINVANYGMLRYQEIYDGIDLLFYGNGQHLEHDFIVSPGADPRRIRLSIQGSDKIRRGRDGSLWVKQGRGWLVFEKPVAYQQTLTGRRAVSAGFTLHGHELSFRLGQYDKTQSLTIDPVLVYSTYVAGPHGATPAGIAVDGAGNAYITGLTFATDYPTTAASFQPTCNSCGTNLPDAFVTKLNASGTALVYSTYLGGSDYDQPFSIAVDGNGNAIIGGRTQSSDFPTLPAVTPAFTFGSTHGFITSLNAAGNGLNWSHYSGGTTGSEIVNAVAVDATNNVYASGTTDSSDFPVTPGTIQHSAVGFPINDIFVIKFDPSGVTQYSAVLGHNGSPSSAFSNSFSVGGIAVDSASEAVIVGSATPGLPTTPGSLQPTSHAVPNSQNTNAFIVKLAPDASSLVFGTYLGGSGGDFGRSVALDTAGNIYVTGSFGAGDFPTTPGAFQTIVGNFLNCCAAFVSKLNPSGSQLLYSTFLGGTASSSSSTDAFSIAVDNTGNAYVAGETRDESFPLVNPLRSLFPTGFGFTVTSFASKFDATASHLLFSTIFSGSTATNGTSVALDGSNAVYITGTSFDTDLPTTPGAFQTSVTPPPPNNFIGGPFIAKLDAVAPAPSACFSPSSHAFPTTLINSSSSPAIVTFKNCGNADVSPFNISASPSFSLQSNTCGTSVAAGASCSLTVVFTPTQVGAVTGKVTISSGTSALLQGLLLSGTGASPLISLPQQFNFDPMLVGVIETASLPVQNVGVLPASVTALSATGDFAVVANGCGSVGPGAACNISLSFTPGASGSRTGTLTLTDTAAGSPHVVQLAGTGLTTYPIAAITATSPQAIPAGLGENAPLSLTGKNFFPASIVRVNGTDRVTTFTSTNAISTTLSPSDVLNPGELSITVFNPAPGGGVSASFPISVYRTIIESAAGMVYDPFSRRLYVSLSAHSSTPNNVVSIDPETGEEGVPIPVGNQPGTLAISDDGKFLYVGLDGDHAIARVNLAAQVVDALIPLPQDVTSTPTARQIVTVPGHPNQAIVVLSGLTLEGGIAFIQDGAVLNSIPFNSAGNFLSVDSVAFISDPATFYGADEFTFSTFNIGATGVSVTSRQPLTILGSGLLASDGVKLYTTLGRILDPATGSVTAQYPVQGSEMSVLPLTEFGHTLFLDLIGPLKIFDQGTLQLSAVINFPDQVLPADLLRLGPNTFAFRYFNPVSLPSIIDQIIVFRDSLVGGNNPNSPTPAITAISPASSNATGVNFLLTVTGSSFAPGAVVRWNGSDRTTRFVSSSQLIAAIPGTDVEGAGTAQVTAVNPGAVASPAVSFTINAGATPFADLSPGVLDFGGQAVGAAPGPQTVTFRNGGNAPLNISGISVTGDYKQTNTCGASLASGASCQISVTFSATAVGTRTGVLRVTDDAPGSPHQIALHGTGVDFQLVGVGGNTAALIQSGQNAVYNLNVIPVTGFTGSVTFSCTGAPAASNCTADPVSVSVTGTSPVPFAVVVFTTSRSAAAVPRQNQFRAGIGVLGMLALIPVILSSRSLRRNPKLLAVLFVGTVLVLGMVACGGGGSGPPSVTKGTPAGTYNLTVTATSGSVSRQIQLTLVVR